MEKVGFIVKSWRFLARFMLIWLLFLSDEEARKWKLKLQMWNIFR